MSSVLSILYSGAIPALGIEIIERWISPDDTHQPDVVAVDSWESPSVGVDTNCLKVKSLVFTQQSSKINTDSLGDAASS